MRTRTKTSLAHGSARAPQESLLLDAGAQAEPEEARGSEPSGPLNEQLLDARQAASLLRIPRSTLYELVRSRGLPHVRVGRRGMRFTRADLSYWIARNTVHGGRG